MSKEYDLPSWSASLSYIKQDTFIPFYLEILKEGIIIDKIDLFDKVYYIIGRQTGLVDIQLDHPSISRKHAVLQYRDDGALMILDLGSAQGTTLNKKVLEKDTFQRIYVGDIIKFGASTRLYIVNGPSDQQKEEYDSVNMQIYRKKLLLNSMKVKEIKKETANMGVSWGFRDDAEDAEDDENDDVPDYIKKDENYDRKYGEKYKTQIDDSEVNKKDQDLLDKIRKKEQKIVNMQDENKKIYLKEGGQENGLTEGQISTVARNDKRIESLNEEIQNLIDQIKNKNLQRQGKEMQSNNSSNTSKRDREELLDFDESLDLTSQTQDVNTNWRLRKKLAKQNQKGQIDGFNSNIKSNIVHTYESLTIQKLEVIKKMDNIKKLLNLYELDKQNQIRMNENNILLDSDSIIDNMLVVSNEKEINQNILKLKNENNELLHSLQGIDELLKIATPDIIPLSKKKDNIANDNTNITINEIESNQSISEKIDDINTCYGVNNDELSITKNKDIKQSSKKSNPMQSLASFMKFAEKEMKDEVNIIDNVTSEYAEGAKNTINNRISVSNMNNKDKKAVIYGPQLTNDNKITNTNNSEVYINNNNNNNNTLQGGDLIWIKPKNQTGDGKTELNAKFGY